MGWKDGEVDGDRARVKESGPTRVEALYDLQNPAGHSHIVADDGVSASFVREGGKTVWDERDFIKGEKEHLIGEAEQLSLAQGFPAAHRRAQELRAQFKTAGFAGERTEPELRQRFERALQRFYDQSKVEKERRDKARVGAARKKRVLVREAQRLAESSEWKSGHARFKELFASWKALPNAGPKNDDLWRDFSQARIHFRQRADTHFARLEREREQHAEQKRRLVAEALRLAGSTDLRSAFPAMRALMERWKQIGAAGREEDARLWRAFQEARDRLHARSDSERSRAALLKRELVAEASSIAAHADLRHAGQQWKLIMQRWKQAGHAHRITDDDLWSRLQTCKRQLDARYEQYKQERAERQRQSLQRLQEAADRKRSAALYHEGRAAELQSRPPVGPGPSQWEFASQRNDKISEHRAKAASISRDVTDIEAKIRNAASRL
jgi:hypothetical protein